MMKLTAKKFFITLCAAGALALPQAYAQLGSLDDLTAAGAANANYLVGGYMNPAADGFGAGLNTGWIQSAQPHGFLPIPGFHLRISAQLSMIPTSDRTFNIDPARLTGFSVVNNQTATPTLSGRRNAGRATLRPNGVPTNAADITMPKGVGLPAVLSPMLQVGIGLPKKSQLMIRYMPETALLGDRLGTVGLWGVGFQHEVLQYIPLAKRIPLLNISVIGGYTNFNLTNDLGGDRELAWNTRAWNANLIAGLTTPFIKILSVYAGAGFERATSTLKMTGTYNVGTTPLVDPVDIEFSGSNGVRMVAGARVKLGLLTINGEYTRAAISTGTVGFGLSFR